MTMPPLLRASGSIRTTVTTALVFGWCAPSLFPSSGLWRSVLCPLIRRAVRTPVGVWGRSPHVRANSRLRSRDHVVSYSVPAGNSGPGGPVSSCGAARGTTRMTMPPLLRATGTIRTTVTTTLGFGWCARRPRSSVPFLASARTDTACGRGRPAHHGRPGSGNAALPNPQDGRGEGEEQRRVRLVCTRCGGTEGRRLRQAHTKAGAPVPAPRPSSGARLPQPAAQQPPDLGHHLAGMLILAGGQFPVKG